MRRSWAPSGTIWVGSLLLAYATLGSCPATLSKDRIAKASEESQKGIKPASTLQGAKSERNPFSRGRELKGYEE